MVRQQHRLVGDGARIRRLAASENADIMFTCDEKLRKHEITRPDALAALMTCTVVKSEPCRNQWQRTVKGFDRDEGEISLVVTVDPRRRMIVVLDGWR